MERAKKQKTKIWAALLGLVIVLLAVLIVVLWMKISSTKKYQEQLSMGEKYLAELQYEDAEICFKEAIAISPKRTQPYIQLSTVYMETNRHEEAIEILNEVLEIIPDQDVQQIEAVQNRLTQIEKEQEAAGEAQSSEGTPLEIAMAVMNLPYLSENPHVMQYQKTSQYSAELMPITPSGIVGADRYDYDRDGTDEILVISLFEYQEEQRKQIFLMHMLEKEEEGWQIAAEKDLGLDYEMVNTILCPERFEFFAKVYDDHVGIFYEATGYASFFADGIAWELSQVQYQDQTFTDVGQQIETAGSDGTAQNCLELNRNPQMFDAGTQQYILDFIGQVDALGFENLQKLGWDTPITEQDGTLRKILRCEKTTDLNLQTVLAWQNSDSTAPLGPVNVVFTDFQKDAVPDEDTMA